jgi:hypothetical protein
MLRLQACWLSSQCLKLFLKFISILSGFALNDAAACIGDARKSGAIEQVWGGGGNAQNLASSDRVGDGEPWGKRAERRMALRVVVRRPIAAFTPQPNDACQRKEMSSPGMLSYLNAKIGQPYGPSARVVGIQSLQGYPAATGSYLTCQGTIVLESGAQESGTLSVQDPGGNAPVQVSWESEAAKAKRLDSPEKRAITKFCATATPQGCALYVRKISGCRPLASAAYSVLAKR